MECRDDDSDDLDHDDNYRDSAIRAMAESTGTRMRDGDDDWHQHEADTQEKADEPMRRKQVDERC